MSKHFVCHVLKNQQTNTAKLLYADVQEANLSTTFRGNRNGRSNKNLKSRMKV